LSSGAPNRSTQLKKSPAAEVAELENLLDVA
jgi:hypothetical protein